MQPRLWPQGTPDRIRSSLLRYDHRPLGGVDRQVGNASARSDRGIDGDARVYSRWRDPCARPELRGCCRGSSWDRLGFVRITARGRRACTSQGSALARGQPKGESVNPEEKSASGGAALPRGTIPTGLRPGILGSDAHTLRPYSGLEAVGPWPGCETSKACGGGTVKRRDGRSGDDRAQHAWRA